MAPYPDILKDKESNARLDDYRHINHTVATPVHVPARAKLCRFNTEPSVELFEQPPADKKPRLRAPKVI